MPSFPDSIFLFVLALLLFGPKRLPVLARELGKWVGEFRRASNEFKMQMEDELRLSEQADRNKQIAAMEAAAPVTPAITEAEPAQLDAGAAEMATDAVPEIAARSRDDAGVEIDAGAETAAGSETAAGTAVETAVVESVADTAPPASYEVIDGVRTPLPIATSGELKIMPPATGLPTPQGPRGERKSALTGLLDAMPSAGEDAAETAPVPETTAHGN